MIGMLDTFLENSFLYFYGLVILLALFRYSKFFDTPLKYLPILLMYTFLTELLGTIIKSNTDLNPLISGFYSNYTLVFYNTYNFIFFLYFFYIFWSFISSEKYRKNIVILSISFIIISLINPFFQNYILKSQFYAYSYGGLVLIYCIILYLKENNKILRSKFAKQSLLFWISIGLLIFYAGYIPIKTYYSFSSFENKELFYNLRRIHLSLICIMYSCFIYGFIQMKGKLKTP